jgi:segregation and condensation protein B
LKQNIEAILFTAGNSIKTEEILEKLPGVTKAEFDEAVSELKQKYSGDSGILLLSFNGKLQFSSNQLYGDLVADVLLPLKEKELSKTLLEVLAIVAYKQPITRLEIDDIRGVGSEYAIQTLSRLNLITVIGRKESVGRPSLYATTDEFLKRFELESIANLPDYEELLEKIRVIEGTDKLAQGTSLYKEVNISTEPFEDGEISKDEIPDDLLDENGEFEVIE